MHMFSAERPTFVGHSCLVGKPVAYGEANQPRLLPPVLLHEVFESANINAGTRTFCCAVTGIRLGFLVLAGRYLYENTIS